MTAVTKNNVFMPSSFCEPSTGNSDSEPGELPCFSADPCQAVTVQSTPILLKSDPVWENGGGDGSDLTAVLLLTSLLGFLLAGGN